MYVIGCDPGLANFGWAVVRFDEDGYTLDHCGVWRTQKSDRKLRVLAGEDNFRRAWELAVNLEDLFRNTQPVAVCTEGMSFPQNASASAKLALSWGALAGVCAFHKTPTVHTSPQQIKMKLCGKRNASKLEVEEAVKRLEPDAALLLDEVPKTRREHTVDAFASVLTGLESDVIRTVRKMI